MAGRKPRPAVEDWNRCGGHHSLILNGNAPQPEAAISDSGRHFSHFL